MTEENKRKKLKSSLHVMQGQVADDFDELAESYERKINQAIAFGGREHQFYIDVKRDHIIRLVEAHFARSGGLHNLDVLDLGCGIGAYHQGLKNRFHELHGIDVSPRSVEVAKRNNPFVHYETFDGTRLPYDDERFDVSFAICVMHHVPPSGWLNFTREMHRVLKPGGLALVFEHNPYNPATQFIVKTCDIDKDAVLLRPGKLRQMFENAGFSKAWTRTILSVPPSGSFLTRMDHILGHLPFGAQYYMAASKTLAQS